MIFAKVSQSFDRKIEKIPKRFRRLCVAALSLAILGQIPIAWSERAHSERPETPAAASYDCAAVSGYDETATATISETAPELTSEEDIIETKSEPTANPAPEATCIASAANPIDYRAPAAPSVQVTKNQLSNHISQNPIATPVEDDDSYYAQLTAHEIHILEVIIQHEVGNFSKTYKTLIAELLYNRLKSPKYPDTVEEMAYQKPAFQGIDRWYSPQAFVDEETKAVIKEVFSQEDTSHKATGYYNPAYSSAEGIWWFEESGAMEFQFEYSEKSYGVTYTTRFFA